MDLNYLNTIITDMLLTEAFTPNRQSLIDLVKSKRMLTFYYLGDDEEKPGWRTVKPVCYGNGYVNRNGDKVNSEDYLRAWQDKGPSVSKDKKNNPMPGWRFFKIDRIRNWNLSSNKNFTEPPSPLFNANGDANLHTIYAISDFTPDKTDAPDTLGPKSGPKKPVTPQARPGVDKPEDEPATGSSGGSSSTPTSPSQKEPTKPTPAKQHYASSRTPKPVVKMRNNKPVVRIRKDKPIFKIREEFVSGVNNLINSLFKN